MVLKRPYPMISRLSELLVSGNRTGGFSEVGTSPRSPLDFKIQSPRGLKSYDLGGVGLGIVAALDKSSNNSGEHEVLAKYAISSPNSNRSVPIPVINCGENCGRWMKGGFAMDSEIENSESYTYVTRHGPDNKCITKVYYDGCEHKRNRGIDIGRCDDKFGGVSASMKVAARHVEDVSLYPTSDFLSCCHLCKKKLHGKDIYMYRGEKAFCSEECRSRQIMMDERKEQCRSELLARSADVSSSPYTRSPIFSTGIVAI